MKLVAIDMDGTLLDSQQNVSEETCRVIGEAKKHDVLIVLCSGRPVSGLKKVMDLLPEDVIQYVIANNGALVKDIKSDKVIGSIALDKVDVEKFHDLIKGSNMHMCFHDFNHILTLSKDINQGLAENVVAQQCNLEVLDSLTDDLNGKILKIQFLDKPEKLDALEKQIPKNYYDTYYIVRSVDNNLEVLHAGVNKWEGISQLITYLGIPKENTYGIGDEENDREMLENVGYAIVMKNGNESVKDLADFITKSNDEDGVAYALEHIVFKR